MERRGKKRKRKSFLVKARKYGKKGCYGRGSNLEEDVYKYFLRVMEMEKQEFETEEEKKTFVTNVFEETREKEVYLSCNQLVSRVIENLLPASDEAVTLRFISAFKKELRLVFVDQFASHVMQKLLTVVTERAGPDEESEGVKFLMTSSAFFLNNFDEFVWEKCASHVGRTCATCLAKLAAQDFVKANTELSRYATKLISAPQLKEICWAELGSGLVQVVVQALGRVTTASKSLKTLVRTLLDKVYDEESSGSLPQLFTALPPTRLLEECMEVARKKELTQIYARLFINRLQEAALSPTANFSLQKLLTATTEKAEFEGMVDELLGGLKETISVGHTGVLVAIAKGCVRHSTRQGAFIKSLRSGLDIGEGDDSALLEACLGLGAPPQSASPLLITLHGSLLVQALLGFAKPINMVRGLLAFSSDQLVNLASDIRGSHVVDAMFMSAFVGEKSRQAFFKKLKGRLVEVGRGKHGSYTVEAVWKRLDIEGRLALATELLEAEAQLTETPPGRLLSAKFALPQLRHDRQLWINSNSNANTAVKLFSQIIS